MMERKKALFEKPAKKQKKEFKNIFEKEAYKQEHETTSHNGSLKYDTSGNIFIDDFANLSRYLDPRDINDVFADMNLLWKEDALIALKIQGYIRGITRQPYFNGEKLSTFRAQGLKNEARLRLLWIALYKTKTYKKNLPVFIAEGSWKDLFIILELMLSYKGLGATKHTSWHYTLDFIIQGLKDPKQSELVKKFLPTIRPIKEGMSLHRQCISFIGKQLAVKLFDGWEKSIAYKKYRQLKASGTAHTFQQLISKGDYQGLTEIFDKIPGKALTALTSDRTYLYDQGRKYIAACGDNFISRHNLDKQYIDWINKQSTAKFTGYPFELFKNSSKLNKFQKLTINKQFETLLNTAKQDMTTKSNFICCIDTSGSMQSEVRGTNMTSFGVAFAMGLYFSELLTGKFANTFLEFNSSVKVRSFEGDSYIDKYNNAVNSYDYVGSTNFLGVAELFIDLKKKGYSESDFPSGVICISDGEFDSYDNNKLSTFKRFKQILRGGGFSDEFVDNFTIVLWDIPNGYYSKDKERQKFESFANEKNFFYMAGFDGAAMAFLTGTEKQTVIPKTPEELFDAAMNQELLLKLTI